MTMGKSVRFFLGRLNNSWLIAKREFALGSTR